MASTEEGKQLTEQQRLAQIAIRAQFLSEFLPMYRLLNWDRLDDTTPGWLAAVMSIVRVYRQESADVAESYYDRYRKVELVGSSATPVPKVEFIHAPEVTGVRAPDPNPHPVIDLSERRSRTRVRLAENRDTSDWVKPKIDWSRFDDSALKALRGAGPNYLKQQSGRGETEERAARKGLTVVSGTASRLVLDGGRDTMMQLIKTDPVINRYIRVTDGDPCSFCAMLAGRGPVYLTEESAGFQPHDHCACTAEPVANSQGAWPGDAAYYRRLWRDNIEGQYSGQAAINAWRRLYEGLQREARKLDVSAAITA
jgi:hypothetical protein